MFSKIGENVENQTGVSYREQKSSDRDFSDTVSDRVTHSSMELLSASDTSDLPDRRQHDILSGDGKGDNEVYNRLATPESDLSAASSSVSEGARKRRKDKSSLRKSKLNESSDGKNTLLCPQIRRSCGRILVSGCPSVRASIRSSKTVHARVLKFYIWIPHGKIFDTRFFFV